jgi:hypothetical protein
MSANLFGTAGLSWGLTAETGLLVQSYSRTVAGEEKIVKNHEGLSAGVSLYDASAEHTVTGYTTAAGGINAASFGTALVIANVATGNGVAAGEVLCTGVTNTLENEDFAQLEATAKQWPLITGAIV